MVEVDGVPDRRGVRSHEQIGIVVPCIQNQEREECTTCRAGSRRARCQAWYARCAVSLEFSRLFVLEYWWTSKATLSA